VISLNFSGLEKNSGFRMTLPMLRKALAAVAYGDLLMLLSNQTRPYEVLPGETDTLVARWITTVSALFARNKALSGRAFGSVCRQIVRDFAAISLENRNCVKVGIVGEIYVKYAKLGNNDLEGFLHAQGCEINVPGMMGFLLYCVENGVRDKALYGGSSLNAAVMRLAEAYICSFEKQMLSAVRESGRFHCPGTFRELKRLGEEIIGPGCKMGEGWLLTAEMVELVRHGYENIVCTQPFGCLPNHIAGKGMIRKIRERYPQSNIVPIDYDPGATRVNQENRIKLMLAVAKEERKEA